jgi:hypothetical protein
MGADGAGVRAMIPFAETRRCRVRALILLAHLLLLLSPAAALAVANAPVPNEQDRAQAMAVDRMTDASPTDRVVKLMKAAELEREALFVLAGYDPILVEQLIDEQTRVVVEYLSDLPATELADLRAGNTVVRRAEGWGKLEWQHLIELATLAGIPKAKKLESVRIGVITGSNMRFELFGAKGDIEIIFAIAPTPVREERAREKLTKHFGARPTEITRGPGTRLPLEDSSFENEASIGDVWTLEPCVTRGGTIPEAQIALDTSERHDGRAAVRFHSDVNTRYWPQLSQRITVAPGTSLVLRGHVKGHYLRRERDQERVFRLALEFEDIAGNPVGEPVEAALQTGDMDWRQFVVTARAPMEADYVKVVLASTISGTAWFDGLSLEIGY